MVGVVAGRDNRPDRDLRWLAAVSTSASKNRPGGVGRAVLAVGAAGEQDDAAGAVVGQLFERRQNQLLISPAQPAARRIDQFHHRLAAADETAPAARRLASSGAISARSAADLLRRSFRALCALGRHRVAEPLRLLGRGLHGRGVVADHDVGRRGTLRCRRRRGRQRLRCTTLRRYSNTAGETPAARASKCSNTSSAACGVEESGTVGPEAMVSSGSPSTSEIIERDHLPGAARPQQPAAFDAAELLADRIELLDVRPGRAKMSRDGQLVGQSYAFDRAPASGPSRRRRSDTGRDRPAPAIRPVAGFLGAGDTLGRGLVDPGGPSGVQMDSSQADGRNRPAR